MSSKRKKKRPGPDPTALSDPTVLGPVLLSLFTDAVGRTVQPTTALAGFLGFYGEVYSTEKALTDMAVALAKVLARAELARRGADTGYGKGFVEGFKRRSMGRRSP